MSELILPRDDRLALRSRAHHLNPVVLLGNAGLTDAVVREIDRALIAHELIKIRVPGDDRDAREQTFVQIADTLGAARVQIIGKLLVLYRPRPEVDQAPEATRQAAARATPGAEQSAGPRARKSAKPPPARSPATHRRSGSPVKAGSSQPPRPARRTAKAR